ncbi:sensor histidine kinase [Phytohabitans sp. LJ34]|uniref:sensor histidine kinase n=1 Tax=Phytohabitans sp. LJ34 TaxID=3452217 RepID=UPI003F8C6249
MRGLRLAVFPAALCAATLVLEAAGAGLSWGLESRFETVVYAVYVLTLAVSGALIASRHPGNPIGWLYLGTALFTAITGDVAQGWGLRAAANGWPGGPFGEWVAAVSWIPCGTAVVFTILLFPDGRLPRSRWRAVGWANAAGAALLLPGWALSPDIDYVFLSGRNPYAIPAVPTGGLVAAGMVLFLGSLVLSVVPLVRRLRRATGVERQQLKWVVFGAGLAAALLPPVALLWGVTPLVQPVAAVALVALPVATCVAILRYRLYDIDLVISRTLGYLALTALLAAAYAASVLLLGIVVGRRSPWATAGATLVVAVAFKPLRDRIQAAVDRRFNRARYTALERVETFLERLRAGRAVPEEIETVLREAVEVGDLDVRINLPDGVVDLRGRPIAGHRDDGRDRWPIRRGGTTLGEVLVGAPSERVRALLPTLVDAGALAVEMARLRVELRRQLAEVGASRARIVAVADAERRRIERDLHDGAQQRLVSIGLALRHAQHALDGTNPEARQTLDGAIAEITVAIDELRELAQGLRPAHLDGGLGPALRELARRAPLPVRVDTTADRFPAEVETAAYFTACEGLTNAVKHARATAIVLSAGRDRDTLVVRVADDGVGGAHPRDGSGLTGLSDRVATQGGRLTVDSVPGRGTVLTAEFPCVW